MPRLRRSKVNVICFCGRSSEEEGAGFHAGRLQKSVAVSDRGHVFFVFGKEIERYSRQALLTKSSLGHIRRSVPRSLLRFNKNRWPTGFLVSRTISTIYGLREK